MIEKSNYQIEPARQFQRLFLLFRSYFNQTIKNFSGFEEEFIEE
jgi:hypothetical protein